MIQKMQIEEEEYDEDLEVEDYNEEDDLAYSTIIECKKI